MTLLTACRTTPPFQPAIPQSASQSGFEIAHSNLLDENNHMLQPIDNINSIIYFQNYGGGGAGLGLMLGVIGAAANTVMIKSKTMNDVNVLKGKLSFNPKEIFVSAAKSEGFNISENETSTKTKISPYIYISKTEGENLLIVSAALIEQGDGKAKWVGKYMYQLPIQMTLSELSKLDTEKSQKLQTSITEGYKKIISKIATEKSFVSASELEITFKSNLLSPRFDLEMLGSLMEKTDGVTWIRTSGGIYGIQNSNISYKLAQK